MRVLVVLLGASALLGCASRNSDVPLNTYQTIAAREVPAPGVAGGENMPPVPADYRLNPLDQVRIDVFGEPELSLRDLPVSPGGTIQLPLAGEIPASGSTTGELSRRIAGSLQRYLHRPQVAVNVTQFVSQKVTIEGSVRSPGVFQALHQMTLLEAIALGQGLNDYAKQDEILVFRRMGGQRYVARFDLGLIQRGEAADPAILPGDIVVVGYSEARRLFSDVISVLPLAIGAFAVAVR